MEYLEIAASISMQKLNEFNQSKLYFIEHVGKFEGYNGFVEKPGRNFNMRIGWNDHDSLVAFMKSEPYKFFHGAMITLSENNSIRIFTEDGKLIEQ
jgi:hypothetical protein